jgi:uncharacterized membrane protein
MPMSGCPKPRRAPPSRTYVVRVFNVRRVGQSLLPADQPQVPWGRVNNLIDGVFGFSATVLMLRLATPVYQEGELGSALLDQAPYYLVYGLGFLQIVGTWNVMRRMSAWSTGIDYYGMLFAFVALMMWATLPFTLDILTVAIGNADDMASALRLMSLTLLAALLGFTALWWRLEHRDSFREDLDPDVFECARLATKTILVWPLAVYLLSYVNTWASLTVYVCAVLVSLVPLETMTTEQYAADDASS